MTAQKDIVEIRERDFFRNVDHFHDFDDVETALVMGEWPAEEVFLTVIIPVYDHPIHFITRAIDSALNQEEAGITYRLLIIDDYAVPGGDNGVEAYLRAHPDPRILYYKNRRNMGVFGNWNRGIQLARSKWVALLHSDDFYKPNYLKNMIPIIRARQEIDQLACRYGLLDYTKNDVDEAAAMARAVGSASLRKVDYREYTYEMFTSVKGSLYKRDTLIEIGGFRSQGMALGLDDYPLMMRYAYHYNTYYLDAVLYMDSWGFNDSLNIKHWYPQLIADYFMWKDMERKRGPLVRWAYDKKDKYMLIDRARAYADGTSYIGKKIPVDFKELYQICGIRSEHIPKLTTYIGKGIVKADQKWIKLSQKRVNIELV